MGPAPRVGVCAAGPPGTVEGLPGEGWGMDERAGSELVITTEHDDGTLVLVVCGDLDAYSAPLLDDRAQQFGRHTGTNVVLDLSGASFVDSSGLRALLSAHQQLDALGKTLVLRDPSDALVRLLEIAGLRGHFTVAP